MHKIHGRQHISVILLICKLILKPEPFPKQALDFTCLLYKSFENTAGKGEIASDEQFLLFPQCFLPIWRTFCHYHQIENSHLQTLSIWKSLQFAFGKGLKAHKLPNINISCFKVWKKSSIPAIQDYLILL